MGVASHKTLMCNKLCNCLFSDVLAKRPALDAWSALAGIRPSRVWTLGVLWTGRGCPERIILIAAHETQRVRRYSRKLVNFDPSLWYGMYGLGKLNLYPKNQSLT